MIGGMQINKNFKAFMLFLIIFSMLFVGVAYAQEDNSTMNVTNDDFESIQVMIDNAKPGDSIYLENKTYYGNGSGFHESGRNGHFCKVGFKSERGYLNGILFVVIEYFIKDSSVEQWENISNQGKTDKTQYTANQNGQGCR